MKREKERNAVAPAAEQEPRAPADWQIGLDRETPIREGLAACSRHGLDLSGSAWEKKHRQAVQLDFLVYRHGGSAENDRRTMERFTYNLRDFEARRAAFERQGLPTAGLDAGIAGARKNLDALRQRIEAAGDAPNQASRMAERDHARGVYDGLLRDAARYEGARLPVPEELEDRIDAAAVRVEETETVFEAGRVELEKLIKAIEKAKREARHALATTLRERVLERLAASVREAMQGKVALYSRRPEKPLPPEVQRAMREAEAVSALADTLSGEIRGIGPFVALLGEDVALVTYPMVEVARFRRKRREPGEKDALTKEIGVET